jgi:phage shock protein PspC (stress-responsive transcriptional regulator)
MKKTIHINLSGIAFRIEEDAYDQLKEYLDAVQAVLGSNDEGRETINDIESRMAELFIPVTHENQVAVNLKDVEEVIKILGEPRDYAPADEDADGKSGASDSFKKEPPLQPIHKRLYRDPYSRVVGGVCSGLGAYFNVDPLLFRLLFVVGLFFGISIIPYLVLWIAMPKALTMEQRMQMFGGEPVFNKARTTSSSYMTAPSGLNQVLRIAGVVLGVGIILVSFALMVGMTVALFFTGPAVHLVPEAAILWDVHDMLFSQAESLPILFGLMLVCGIPLLLIFYLGLHLVFQFKRGGKLIGTLGLIFWLVGLGLLSFGALRVGLDFRNKASIEEVILPDAFNGDTLFLQAAQMPEIISRSGLQFNHIRGQLKDGNMTFFGEPKILIRENAEHFAMVIERQAKGASEARARVHAEMAEYFWLQKDSVLELDKIFSLPAKAKIRDQKVTVRISVPKGKVVQVDPELQRYVRWSVN